MTKSRILIVEDEYDVAALIKDTVERNGDAEAEIVDSSEMVLKAVSERPPDLLVLDLNLTMLDGAAVCRILRSRTETQRLPIIILTTRAREYEGVTGLEVGADDYITKPFSPRELTTRVREALRRSDGRDVDAATTIIYRGQHLTADFDAVAVSVDGRAVRLTRRQFELLHYLVQNKNRVVSRDQLRERVWGHDRCVKTRSVDVHVGRLRGKLGAAGQQVETVIGLGYRFVD